MEFVNLAKLERAKCSLPKDATDADILGAYLKLGGLVKYDEEKAVAPAPAEGKGKVKKDKKKK